MSLDWNAEEFVTHAIRECEIGSDLVGILSEASKFPLPEAAQIGGRARAGVIEKLCLRLKINPTKERPNQVLQSHARQDLRWRARAWFEARARRGWNPETRENGRVRYRPRGKIVRTIRINAAVLSASLYRVTPAHP